jgi:hypothetical protein
LLNTQYSAELQIFHVQYATDNMVALSFLFDVDESMGVDERRLKTCFIDSFDMGLFKSSVTHATPGNEREAPELDVPLKEFIKFVS